LTDEQKAAPEPPIKNHDDLLYDTGLTSHEIVQSPEILLGERVWIQHTSSHKLLSDIFGHNLGAESEPL